MTARKRPTAAEGFIRNAAFAVGDPALDPALRKSLAASLRLHHHNEKVAAEQREHDALAKGAPFQGRKPGPTDKVQYIRELVAANPKLYPRQLWDIAEPAKLFGMTESNFLKRASEARKKK